jgi:hypothetical protein
VEKFTRMAIDVTAVQWFPFKMIPVEGFKNIQEELFRGMGGEKVNAVVRAEIDLGEGKKLDIFPTDWVVFLPEGAVMVMKEGEFTNTFVKSSDYDLLNKLGSAEDLAKFGLKMPPMPEIPKYTPPVMPTYPYPGKP